MCKIIFLLMSIIYFKPVISANIFGFFFIPSYSHQEVYQPLYKELSLRGHNVTVVTPNPLNDSTLVNLTEIDVSYTYKLSSFITDITTKTGYKSVMIELNKQMENVIELTLQDKHFKAFYQNSTQKYDLVIIENHSPLLHAFGEIFDAPIVGIASTDALLSTQMSLGNPIHPALYGDCFISSFLNMTLWKKVQNTFNFLWMKWHYDTEILPRCNKKAKIYFGDKIQDLEESSKRVALMFVNTNHYIHQFRPLGANMISLTFMHVKSVKALPKDLQNIMDKATEGIVYLSFGSNVKSSSLPTHFLQLICKVLSELPYLVLWKWEVDSTSLKLGKNIVTRKWFPQSDILAHPNIKVFVTQGGLQSIEEAISRVVPMVGVPFIADQLVNVERIANLKIAEMIDWETVTQYQFTEAILKVAERLEYKEKIIEIRDYILDQPLAGLEKAVWWSEYVMRHKGAKHLRSILADTPLWEYLLLDVIAVISFILIVTSCIVYNLITVFRRKIKLYRQNKVKVT